MRGASRRMYMRCSLMTMRVQVGSRFYTDEEVAVIETDKVAVSVRARQDGIVRDILASLGMHARVCARARAL